MADTIPDLWPTSALKMDVLPPIAILRTQATYVGQKTHGLLGAEVRITTGGNGQVVLGLDLIAPALNNYRHRLLSAQYVQDETYPAVVSAKGLTVTKSVSNKSILRPSSEEITESVESKTAYSEDAFLRIVREVLQAPETIALLQSLIVRSNEATNSPPLSLPEEDERAEVSDEQTG